MKHHDTLRPVLEIVSVGLGGGSTATGVGVGIGPGPKRDYTAIIEFREGKVTSARYFDN